LRELAELGFSCIGKAVTWRNEMIRQEDEDEDALPTMVLSQNSRDSVTCALQWSQNGQVPRIRVSRRK
jgi:hypothetical protein